MRRLVLPLYGIAFLWFQLAPRTGAPSSFAALGHVVLFLVLGLLTAWTLRHVPLLTRTRLVLLTGLPLALLVEWLQGHVGRTPELADIFADWIGTGIAAGGTYAWAKWRTLTDDFRLACRQ